MNLLVRVCGLPLRLNLDVFASRDDLRVRVDDRRVVTADGLRLGDCIFRRERIAPFERTTFSSRRATLSSQQRAALSLQTAVLPLRSTIAYLRTTAESKTTNSLLE
jgi:hypothetical protein